MQPQSLSIAGEFMPYVQNQHLKYINYHGQNRFSLILILKYINTSHPVMSYILKLRFNIILHLRLGLP
jgi:hypothetical protein